jgi:NADH dehydrogenase
MKVFLTGGTGFVGRHILAELRRRGYAVKALVRRTGSLAGVEELPGDVTRPETFPPSSLQDCQAVVHLVGIIREFPSKGITYRKLHVEATENVLRACREAGIRRYLHMSALGADPRSAAQYHRSKAAAEELVRGSGLDWTIFRPSVIIGASGELITMLVSMVKKTVLPLIGDGSFPVAPVAATTVAQAFVNALEKENAVGKTYELGGDVISFRELLDKITAIQKRKVFYVKVPVSWLKAMTGPLDRFAFLPITREQIIMFEENQPPQDYSIYDDLDLDYRGLEQVLEEGLTARG